MLQKNICIYQIFLVPLCLMIRYIQMESSQHIIHMKRELLVRETFSRQAINYSEDMPADQKDRYIQYLVGKVNELDLDKRAMELAVEKFQGIHTNVLEQLAELQRSIAEVKTELHEERGKRKRAEAKARKLDQQLKYVQKNRFGNKRQNARKDKNREDAADRENEKDRFDGTDGTISAKSVKENPTEVRPVKEKKERGVLTRFLGDAELKSIMTDGYNAIHGICKERGGSNSLPDGSLELS